jgi:hypothetical protein
MRGRWTVRAAAGALALAANLAAAPAWGWGATGHQIVGEIAWRHLDSKAQAEVARLLAGDDETLAYASTWADRVRSDHAYDWASPLHYINGPQGAEDLDLARDCAEPRGCVVGAIERFRAVLADPDAPLAERREALKWVAHFVGDVHQPLHASYAEDRGGNRLLVTFFGEPVNLHYLWDNSIISRYLGGWWKFRSWKGWAERLDACTTTQEMRAWADSTPLDWADESFDLARSHAYAARAGDDLAESYYYRNLPVVELRLRQAGVRLAAVLNQALTRCESCSAR